MTETGSKISSWRIAFRCNPYRAKTHFIWINADDKTTDEEIRQAAYQYKDGLPVDVIDEIVKWAWTNDKPHFTINNQNK